MIDMLKTAFTKLGFELQLSVLRLNMKAHYILGEQVIRLCEKWPNMPVFLSEILGNMLIASFSAGTMKVDQRIQKQEQTDQTEQEQKEIDNNGTQEENHDN